MGYSQFPGGGDIETDGVAIAPRAFGTIGTAEFPFNQGRTATHEIGHYFDLKHIWGGEAASCTDSDDVDDTPNQDYRHFDCPGFPEINCGNGPNGELYMDFMDVVPDDCMHLFTIGQSARMLGALLIDRPNLIDAYTPLLSTTDIPMTCSLVNFNLNDLLTNTAPPGSTIVWSLDGDVSDGVTNIIDPLVQDIGIYFAYFHNDQSGCYNGPSEGVKIYGQDRHITSDT